MTRGSGRKYSMRAWLGLFLLLVTHTVAQTTVLRKVAELQGGTDERNAVLGGVSSSLDSQDARDSKDTVPTHREETFKDADKEIEGLGNKITANNASAIESAKQTESEIKGEGTTMAYESLEIPTIATIDFDKHITETGSPIVDGISTAEPLRSKETESTTNFSEFGSDELHEAVEEGSVSELAEGTTPRTVKPARDRESETEIRKEIETVDTANIEDHSDASVKLEVSLANDTNVNYNPDGTPKAVVIGSGNATVDGELATNDPLAGSTVSDYGPKNEVEILKNVTHPPIMKLTAAISADDDAVRTTTMIYEDPKPKARTILFSRSNNLATGSPKMDESLERISGRTNERIEKPNDSLTTPYPYAKNKIVEPETASLATDQAETSVTKESTDENTIGRQKSVEKLVATESSALFENTIQQFKPVNPKRSGNFSRLAANVDAISTMITPTSSESENLNGTERKEESSTLGKIARDNDIPRGNHRTSETTESGAVGSSVVVRVDGGDETSDKDKKSESFGTSTPGSTFFDGTVTSSTTDGATTLSSSTKRSVLREGSVTEIGEEATTLGGEIVTDSEISSTTIDQRDETTTLSTPIEDISQDDESSKATTESANERTPTVQYEFVGLTESPSSTTSDHYVATSESRNSASSTVVDASTASFPDPTATTEQISTKVPTEPNETRTILKGETSTPPDGVTESIDSTGTFDTTTVYEDNSGTTLIADQSVTPVSENGATATTGTYAETTLSLTPKNGISGRNVAEITTISSSAVEVDTTTTALTTAVDDSNGNTAASNANGVPIAGVSTVRNTEAVVDDTTIRSTNATETPQFTVSSEEVTLFVKIIFEGSWGDLCPSLTNLRNIAASLLSQEAEWNVRDRNIILYQTQCSPGDGMSTTTTTLLLYVVDTAGNFDHTSTELLASLMRSIINFSPTILSVEKFPIELPESNNNAIAVVAVSSVAFICLVLLAGLLFIMRKRQTRFNYGERCRPVSLDAYSLDNVSTYNSVRRKGLARASKRSYGNPAFEDSSVTPSHPLNFAGLSTFCNDSTAINEEFSGIPQVSARIDELPAGAEVKNRYANVIPLPETRVPLQKINNEPLTEYINASYVRGPKNATKYYIACQAPIESTVSDFWRMIWEQQSKVIIMLTDIIENGVEKCVEYIPPSEVTDCHRLYGDYQVTLKKREAKEKYAISTLHLKNLETNTYREVSHIWYLWPTNGVPSDASGLIAVLLEARALQRGGPGPIVIHCSPGTGRTGTLIALDLGIRQYEITRTIDVPRVVYTIRRDRAGAVQTKEQYAFVYKALNLYATKLAGGALESM